MTLYRDRDQDHPQEKEMQKGKMAVWASLTNSYEKRSEAKSKGEKESIGEIRKPSSVINAKKQRKTIKSERLELSSRKLEIPREHFMQRWA